MLLVVLCILF